jgi:hypothetical protein
LGKPYSLWKPLDYLSGYFHLMSLTYASIVSGPDQIHGNESD